MSNRRSNATDDRIPIARLERYSKLESDILKAGEEIRFLARFTGTQRTAFRKLLKKYKKWTGSVGLESRFFEAVLDSPKSFTKLEFGSLLDEYSTTLQSVRSLYSTKANKGPSGWQTSSIKVDSSLSTIEQLRQSLNNGSKVSFDTEFASVPLGQAGGLASYFVHSDNLIELQVLLLQYLQCYAPRSRTDSVASSRSEGPGDSSRQSRDYFTLVADDIARLASEHNALTFHERECVSGLPRQRARFVARWTKDEHAMIAARSRGARVRTARLKRKHVTDFFEKTTKFSLKTKESSDDSSHSLEAIRQDYIEDDAVPLFHMSSDRTRFMDLRSVSKGLILATLDANITIEPGNYEPESTQKPNFPFAVLQLRSEGQTSTDLLQILDQSHLLERVRGFSLHYHAVWQACETPSIAAPFWLPMLSRDIRKLPPPDVKTRGSVSGRSGLLGSGSQSATQASTSTNSILGTGDSTTAAETERHVSMPPPDELESAPLRSFRKKRRSGHAKPLHPQHQRYWSEYDHNEDGETNNDAYVLYIDPEEKSTLERLFDRLLGSVTGRKSASDEEAALLPSPTSPKDDETSSDEEDAEVRRDQNTTYGTLRRHGGKSSPLRTIASAAVPQRTLLPQTTTICLAASVAILVVAYILASASGHKYTAEADVGILFSIGCSLAFAVVGFVTLLRQTSRSRASVAVVIAVIMLDAVCSGGLLAWVLG